MSRYIEAMIGESGSILIEVSDQTVLSLDSADVVKASPPSVKEVTEKARSAFSQVLLTTRSLAKEFSENLKGISNPPDEVELEFGLKIDAAAGTLIAQAGAEANFIVKFKWLKNTSPANT